MTKIITIFTLIFSVSSLASSQSADKYGPKDFPSEEKWTAIVAAYSPEIKAIDMAFSQINDAQIEQTLTIKGVKYQLGHFKGEPIVIFTTGISVPNAAMTMQMALDYFPIDRVVMMGIAGGVNPDFQPGDIAIPERWYFHDESVYANPKAGSKNAYILPDYYEQALAHYQKRQENDPNAPKYENFGFIHPEEMSVIKQGWSEPQQMPYFTVTPELLDLTEKALASMATIKMPSGQPIDIKIGGNGVTGSVFLDNADYRNWLQRVYDAQVAEMESAAVGQVCFVNEVDWIVIRSISDLAGGQQGKNVENVFDAIASGTGAQLLVGLLDQIVKFQAKQ
ncbi:5'-methylthioadenosine/S-adenosylhomocysteine nucleosidase [Aliiglaciecola sp. 3_MG-2023]|uniref:5'-methylthioadenosine/S-adenosylhomocysteine nucleosidase family protein n=1 Tax=Aliiglaciecola sp. 3_MG-2023 TaxID=3062644 RepID=UPI0026E1B072|nr:5'-methylthioadenosine/S-adenosylhomocysteine nucleosidase [Aliiglaciecola sp. 3_MG-2023]MDO6694151.1 5'-methylthioadenosine/S-adenosylhomocysteine nucleosidase [Aliiglaciecola sp. 3_MG-2023]